MLRLRKGEEKLHPRVGGVGWARVVGLNPYANASVRDVWAAQGLGLRLGHFCAQVASHDMALFVLRQ